MYILFMYKIYDVAWYGMVDNSLMWRIKTVETLFQYNNQFFFPFEYIYYYRMN